GLAAFLERFFQEQNIRWILGVGILILFGSSLMLVSVHWTAYTPFWKHAILLGYTAGLHAVGQLAQRSLGLRKTGVGLMTLTVLLIPVLFLALRWTHAETLTAISGWLSSAGSLLLLTLSVLF